MRYPILLASGETGIGRVFCLFANKVFTRHARLIEVSEGMAHVPVRLIAHHEALVAVKKGKSFGQGIYGVAKHLGDVAGVSSVVCVGLCHEIFLDCRQFRARTDWTAQCSIVYVFFQGSGVDVH